MKKILFIVAHRKGRSPGQRFRFEQYLDFLTKNGFSYDFSYIINENDDKIFYSNGKYLKKLVIFIKSLWIRYKDVKRANNYDIIFIYRDAIMLGFTYFERQFKKSKAKIIVDFDDAIWLNDVSEGNKYLAWLKNPSKTSNIVKLSDMVFVGNKYLADYSKQFNSNVKIIPTTIDTDYYIRKTKKTNRDKFCIGWTGSHSTLKHFGTAIPFLKKIKSKYADKVYFKVIADIPFYDDELEILNCKWKKETEVEDLCEIDIGIMPLPDDEWSKGKCGFKGLQYMALEIPSVLSPVGVNTEIINDGDNGFLAKNEDDWVIIISLLIENHELYEKISKNGRKTVIDKFSFESQKNNYLNYLNSLISK